MQVLSAAAMIFRRSLLRTDKPGRQNRIDRSLSINSQPQNLSVFGVYELPFGKNKIGGEHFWVRALLGGWEFSNIFQYSSVIPLAIVATCNATTQNVGAGNLHARRKPELHRRQSAPEWRMGRRCYGGHAGNQDSYLTGRLAAPLPVREPAALHAPPAAGLTATRDIT